MLVDSHCHLDEFQNNEIADILVRAKEANVDLIVTVGTTLQNSFRAVELSTIFPNIWAGIGIHPMEVDKEFDQEEYKTFSDLIDSTDKVIAVSEIGLDFLDTSPDRLLQYQVFREQIRFAKERMLPIIFHSRESYSETLKVLREEHAYDVGGIMHYFQGNETIAWEAIDLGFYISLAKPFLRSEDLQSVVKSIPLENIVLETDAAPQPFKDNRQKWTEPRHVYDIASKLSEIKNISFAQVEEVTTKNFFNIMHKSF
tara:strand:+ start:7781 stop:8548 length:768 start_codon:yes stop_codon:yes gene_type:complete